MSRFTAEERERMQRLAGRAVQKGFLGDLILHAYNHVEYEVDLWKVLRYLEGEPVDSELENDVYTLLSLMKRGVDSHELVGQSVIDELVALKKQHQNAA